jgi:hypothetical protein
VDQGERLLRLAEMCRKLETEHEKVLPFYTSSLTAEEESQERANAMETPSEELAQVLVVLYYTHTDLRLPPNFSFVTRFAQAMLDYLVLERFWQRYNKVLLERLCLERERGALTQENQQLRILLRQYLDGISVSDEILRHRNPLRSTHC